MSGDYIQYMVIIAIFGGLSMLVSSRLKSKFKKYSKVHLQNGMSGKEIAEKMLSDHGIRDVEVISVPGQLTDHYNPQNKTVNLSSVVYGERNAAAAAVAAHEVGHAVQHATAYKWLTMRSKLVPMVSIASKATQFILMGGFMLALMDSPIFLWIAIVIFGIVALFSIVTLPVEYDASNRALAWMKESHVVTQDEYVGAKDALKWAARTYLVAALAAVANVLYFALRLVNSRD
ncbi:MAG: zinc metallopeptidase [Flavobacteriales bacterium]|jgi:Zn-dependent membrane protease YugP